MNKLRNVRIYALSLITLLIISGCNSTSSAKQPGNDSVIPVEVAKVQNELIATGNVYSGVIRPNEEIKLIPKLSGTVVELPVEVGDRVEKGQVLLKLDDKDLVNSVKKLRLLKLLHMQVLVLLKQVINQVLFNQRAV